MEMNLFDDIEQPTKQCTKCKQFKLLKEFPKHRSGIDKLDPRCRECIRKKANIVKELYKIAPPKPKACECCSRITKLVLDHNPETNEFRGWLCMRCNTVIGILGDTVEKVEEFSKKILDYLKTKKKEKIQWKQMIV
jgi:hypothetical protein